MNKRPANIITLLLTLCLLLAPLPAMAKGGVVLNFNDVDISTMVKFISDLTGKNFIMDDSVKGKISVYSPTKLSSEEAFNVFTSILELKGFTIIQAGKVYKIVPLSAAKQAGMKISSDKERGPINEAYVARVITLENISSQEAMAFLLPLVSKGGFISFFGPANMLLVVDSSFNIQKLLGILQFIDTDQRREGGELIFLKNTSADTAAKVVSEWLGGRDKSQRAPGQGTTPGPGSIVIPDARLNALLVSGSDKEKADIKKIVALIDVLSPTSSSKVNVYYMENADATEVAKVLEGVVRGSSAPGAPGAAVPAQQSVFEGGKISVTPDKATNSLVIMASPNDYQNLLQVIQKLDRRSRQVFVEAIIAEVSLDRAKELGVQWGLLGGGTTGIVSAAGVYDPFGTFGALIPILQALTAGGVGTSSIDLTGKANFPVILKALQSNGVLNVLSTPNIMTSDNKEAEIFVGENVPFAGQIQTTGTGFSTQSIDRKDTGITLRIKPQISEGEYIKLDIYQEISAVKNAISKGAAVDITTTKRSAKTSVVMKDNETVVIGGLIQDQDQEIINKIPLLGDIPFFGWLFKTKSTKRAKTNLMILLTPRIIKDARDMAEVSTTQNNRFQEELKNDKPIDFFKGLKAK
ncbi:MAG: type II secretion system secretin GspD [Geobacteraceae bacterium]